MRPRGSIISQLLVTFCVCAILIGVAAVIGYITVTGQNAQTGQIGLHYEQLARENGDLENTFGYATFAVLFYTDTGQHGFLAQLAPDRAAFDRDLAAMRRAAAVQPRTLYGNTLLDNSAALATAFYGAAGATQGRLNANISGLAATSRQRLAGRLGWSGAALAIAVLLVLAASLSTLYTITRPMRRITATVRRLTAGDYSARAPVAGSAEVCQVAESINTQADEADRLRAAEAESNRLRAMAREAGLRIREHLVARDVLHAAKLAVEQIVAADVAYLRLVEDDQVGSVVGHAPRWLIPADVIRAQLPPGAMDNLRALLRVQTSMVINDLSNGEEAGDMPPRLRQMLREAGVIAQLTTPFGVGGELLGLIVLQRMQPGRPWTPAEVDAMESVAADLGRGLNHARLYEAENRLVEDLKALDRAKSDFFATVSHELRTPLTSIVAYVDLLSEEEAGPITPEQRNLLSTVDRNASRLRNLTDDVFTLAKLESGAFVTITRPMNMAEVIAGAVETVCPSVSAAKLTLSAPVPADGLVVEGDAGQLERVLINLLSNSVKYTPAGGRIEVTAAAEAGSVVVRVTDTGIGIPQTDQSKLFDRFFRASNAQQSRI